MNKRTDSQENEMTEIKRSPSCPACGSSHHTFCNYYRPDPDRCEAAMTTAGVMGWCTKARGHASDHYDDNYEPAGVQ